MGRVIPWLCEGAALPRYLVERTFRDGLDVLPGEEGRKRLEAIICCNADRKVTWVHSYVSTDRRTALCVYDAPSPEAIRLTARANGLPVDRIIEVTVLDPYSYHTAG